MRVLIIVVAMSLSAGSVAGQETASKVWKCANPDSPFRFVSSEERKQDPPECKEWIELQGKGLAELLTALAAERHTAANAFLARASQFIEVEYPRDAAGNPATTSALYGEPERFGFRVVAVDSAALGSFVVFDGLGGILVELRDPDTDEWHRKLLYPSAAADFKLRVSDLRVPGKLQAKVLARPGGN